ncbi:hypothetical protein MHBO_005208 [Bonamia ostreae]|uniref:Uncharacterized protein n=1 Tax=Bonamia ostreae TaxID=126728 RepID=A0ABV2AVD6_9EUKA
MLTRQSNAPPTILLLPCTKAGRRHACQAREEMFLVYLFGVLTGLSASIMRGVFFAYPHCQDLPVHQ